MTFILLWLLTLRCSSPRQNRSHSPTARRNLPRNRKQAYHPYHLNSRSILPRSHQVSYPTVPRQHQVRRKRNSLSFSSLLASTSRHRV